MVILITPEDGSPATRYEHQADHLNHHYAMRAALDTVTQDEYGHVSADESLAIIVTPQPEDDEEFAWYPPTGKGSPHPDHRDPYGKVEYNLLAKHTAGTEEEQHEANLRWKQTHPEFALEYLEELQRIEREEAERLLGMQ
ncbi:MAG: hypothetical protein WBG02_01475 [Candidatus Acidiferrum sp.]